MLHPPRRQGLTCLKNCGCRHVRDRQGTRVPRLPLVPKSTRQAAQETPAGAIGTFPSLLPGNRGDCFRASQSGPLAHQLCSLQGPVPWGETVHEQEWERVRCLVQGCGLKDNIEWLSPLLSDRQLSRKGWSRATLQAGKGGQGHLIRVLLSEHAHLCRARAHLEERVWWEGPFRRLSP